jgi:molybdate transport system regulatory protein
MASRSPGRRPAEPALEAHLAPRHKMWLNWKGDFLMGPNYLRFLRAIDEHGTIREAGAVVGWSYRTCLNRIRRMEAVLGAPVLATTRGGSSGGGARLTPVASRLLRLFERWQRASRAESDAAFARALADRRPGRRGR